MTYYFEKVTLSGTASSSKAWMTATSTKAFSGYLAGMYYVADATNPLTAGSSSICYLREDSTAGRILCRSSSGLAGADRVWYPADVFTYSTQWDKDSAFDLLSKIPIAHAKLVLCKVAGATSGGGGSTEGMSVTIYIEGVCP